MLLYISPPPLEREAIEYAALAGAVVIGLLLMLWGRALGRGILGVAAAAAGVLLLAPILAQVPAVKSLNLDLNIVRAAAGLLAGAAAMIAARLLWAAAGGAFFGAIAVALLLTFVWPPSQAAAVPTAAGPTTRTATQRSIQTALAHTDAPKPPSPTTAPARTTAATQPATLAAWSLGLVQSARQAFVALWDQKAAILALALVLPVGVPIVVGIIRPRFGVIFTTSLLGVTFLTLGVFALAVTVHPTIWDAARSNIAVPLSVAVLGFAIAMAYQYRSAKAADANAKKAQTPPQPKPDAPKKK